MTDDLRAVTACRNGRLRPQRGWRSSFLLVVILLALGVAWPPVTAAAEPEPEVEVTTVSGTLSAVSARGISVEYSTTGVESHELYLPVAETVRLNRLKSLAELRPGDRVLVEYERTSKIRKDGQRQILGTAATSVSLLGRAPEDAGLRSDEQTSEEEVEP